MLYMESGIEMEASMGGGVGRSITRAMTGQNFMVVDFKNNGTDGADEHVDRESDSTATVAFAPSTPSKIVPLVLSDHGGSLVCQKVQSCDSSSLKGMLWKIFRKWLRITLRAVTMPLRVLFLFCIGRSLCPVTPRRFSGRLHCMGA